MNKKSKSRVYSKSRNGFVSLMTMPVIIAFFIAIVFIIFKSYPQISKQKFNQSGHSPSQILSPTITSDVKIIDLPVRWQIKEFPEYGLSIEYPSDYSIKDIPSIKPASALSSLLLTPQEYKDNVSPDTPAMILTIYKNTNPTILDWFERHATKLPFDDPSVSMKDSPYYFREYTDPQVVEYDGQEGLKFSSHTMNGWMNHILLVNSDGSYIFDWSANGSMNSGDKLTVFQKVLQKMRFVK